jgi:hypothetical protein
VNNLNVGWSILSIITLSGTLRKDCIYALFKQTLFKRFLLKRKLKIFLKISGVSSGVFNNKSEILTSDIKTLIGKYFIKFLKP